MTNGASEGYRKSILVVDDDVDMLKMIRMYLDDAYEVATVTNGNQALKYLSQKRVDLVLLDYMMPNADGPMVLKQIRKSANQPNVPIVFLTSVAEKKMVMRGLELHPNGYLLKPINRKQLLDKATEILLGMG